MINITSKRVIYVDVKLNQNQTMRAFTREKKVSECGKR